MLLQAREDALLEPAIKYGFVVQKAHHRAGPLPFPTIEAFEAAVRRRVREGPWHAGLRKWEPKELAQHLGALQTADVTKVAHQTGERWVDK